MKRFFPIVLCAGLLATLTAPVFADGLIQSNPAKLAPSNINDIGPAPNSTITTMDHNEYPWFTKDGRLFLWTRQINPSPGTQWLWASYLKNRDDFNSTAQGATLPNLDFGNIRELHEVNHMFEGANPPKPVPPGSEVKAFAICEHGTQPVTVGSGSNAVWRYRMTIYMAIGIPEELREMWRVANVVIKVRQSTGNIDSVVVNGNVGEVIPQTTRPTIPSQQANETEPFFTRDGKYFFWASNAWGGVGNMAAYMDTAANTSSCFQLNQTPKTYSNLPVSKFEWTDQYAVGPQAKRTSRTNYHTLIERDNGDKKTALIFEECNGQVECNSLPSPDPVNNRDCACDLENDRLSTTGFGPGDVPTPIQNLANVTGNSQIWKAPSRATHPAISGPQNQDNSWLLFFMRGKRIWYTKVKED